jgi:C_GCAxxG_C_C family probable redox protein
MPTPPETAATYFERKFNCAQSVLAAFAPGLGMDEQTALRLASPLGGGLARRGEVCGAVSGALLALGLARGSDTPAGKEQTYRLAQDFLVRFEQRHGSLTCRELLGYDIRDPQERERASQAGVFTRLCPLFVSGAAGILQSMLETNP